MKTEALPEPVDPILENLRSLTGELAAWEKDLPICNETLTGKNAVYVLSQRPDTSNAYFGSFAGGLDRDLDFEVDSYPSLPPRVTGLSGAGGVRKVALSFSGCFRLADMVGALGIADKMEAKPKVRAKKADASSDVATLREVRSAPELYSDLDLDRIRERAAELRAASSDSEALSMVFGRSVQIVIHQDE